MSAPELWIIAGPNGAGKTTCAQTKPIVDLLPDVAFFNPDDRTLLKLKSAGFLGFVDAPVDIQTKLFLESANEVFEDLKAALTDKRKVGVETVLSTDKYRALVDLAMQNNGTFCLIYVALASPGIAKQRVAARVARGGHGIPDEKIEQRWTRSLRNLSWFFQRANNFWVVDNSDSNPDTGPILIASGSNGTVDFLSEAAFKELKAVLPR
jgi:predicted ABC-type ATPase